MTENERRAANRALQAAADDIEGELICCPDDALNPRHEICKWGMAARHIVLSHLIEDTT